jgi:O-antigen ligase
MVLVLSILIILSFSTILILLSLKMRPSPNADSGVRLTTLVLCIWLIASAFWGSKFFAIRFPGFIALSIDRFFFAVLVAVLLVGIYRGRVLFKPSFAIELWMLLFSVVCIASMAIHGFKPSRLDFTSPIFVFVSGYLAPFIIFLYAKTYLSSEHDLHMVFVTVFGIGIYLAIIAFFEFFDLRQLVFPRYINDPSVYLHLDRARGPFLNAAFNGLAMVFAGVCGLHALSRMKGPARWIQAGLLCLFFPAVFFTQTRSVYLCFLIALVSFLFFYWTAFPKWKTFALPVALAIFLLAAGLPRLLSDERKAGGVYQIGEIQVRMALIQMSALMIKDHPFLGVGFNQFVPAAEEDYRGRVPIPYTSEPQTQHHHIIGMLVELGVLGTSFYAVILIMVLRRFYQLADWVPQSGFMGANMILSIAIIWTVYLTNNMFIEPTFQIYTNAVPYLLAGYCDGLYGRLSIANPKS